MLKIKYQELQPIGLMLMGFKVKKHKLTPIDVEKIKDCNAKTLEKRFLKANFDDIIKTVRSYSDLPKLEAGKTESCVRFTTPLNRSFHVNVRANVSKQFVEITGTKDNIDFYLSLFNKHYKTDLAAKGYIKVFAKSPREIAEIILLMHKEDMLIKVNGLVYLRH